MVLIGRTVTLFVRVYITCVMLSDITLLYTLARSKMYFLCAEFNWRQVRCPCTFPSTTDFLTICWEKRSGIMIQVQLLHFMCIEHAYPKIPSCRVIFLVEVVICCAYCCCRATCHRLRVRNCLISQK